MIIEPKDFLQRKPRVRLFTGNHAFYEKQIPTEFFADVEQRRGTVYNGGEIQGGFADEI